MKTYYIIFYAFFAVTLYNFVYVSFLQENTYFQYVREYHNAGNTFRQYSIGEDTSNEPDTYELYSISDTDKYLNIMYLKTYPFVIVLFFPLLLYALILLFIKKKYLDKKWWITQSLGFACLFYMVLVIVNNS
jgi:hypothetical protein